jgi:hypothetical protein
MPKTAFRFSVKDVQNHITKARLKPTRILQKSQIRNDVPSVAGKNLLETSQKIAQVKMDFIVVVKTANSNSREHIKNCIEKNGMTLTARIAGRR